MANAIRLKRSGTASSVPQTTDLQLGELALNYNDGKLYYKTSAGTIAAIANGIAPVTSVAGRTGTVTLTSADVSGVVSTTTIGITGATTVTNIVQLTQAQYNAISSPVSTTLYVIVG
jgi:hypothetical protein